MSEVPRSIRDNNDPEGEGEAQRALEDMDMPDSELSKDTEEEKTEERKEAEYEGMPTEELERRRQLIQERQKKLEVLWERVISELKRVGYKIYPEEILAEYNKKRGELSNEINRIKDVLYERRKQKEKQQIDDYRKEIQDI